VTQRFLDAAVGGDIDRLLTVLAPEVTLITDGGGKARAALRPITGAAKVARFVTAIAGRPFQGVPVAEMTTNITEVNGSPGVVVTARGGVIAAMTTLVSDGRITAIHLIDNPDKLSALTSGRTLPL